jgi:hypothetical protein
MSIQKELSGFTGTENWYSHWSKLLTYTDGIDYLAKNYGSYWLIDAIASYQKELQNEPFQIWKLTVQEDKATLTCQRDMEEPILVKQEFIYPSLLEDITLYVSERLLLLPGEY